MADGGVYFVMLIALCEPSLYGGNGGLDGEQGGIQVLMTLVSLHSWASIYLAIEGALVTHKGDDTRVFRVY